MICGPAGLWILAETAGKPAGSTGVFFWRGRFPGGIPSAPGGTFLDGSELVIGSCGNESSLRSNDGLFLRFQEGRHNSESGIFWSITLLVPTSFHGAYPPENQHGTRK